MECAVSIAIAPIILDSILSKYVANFKHTFEKHTLQKQPDTITSVSDMNMHLCHDKNIVFMHDEILLQYLLRA